jgi:hypothetical protein
VKIQEFISNEIMDHIDEWEKEGYGRPQNLETSRGIGIVVHRYARNICCGGEDWTTFNAINLKNLQKRN